MVKKYLSGLFFHLFVMDLAAFPSVFFLFSIQLLYFQYKNKYIYK